MIEHIGALLASFKKMAPVPLLAVSFAAALILFSPTGLAQALGLESFRATHRAWIGAAFIGSVCYLAAHLIWWVRGLYVDRRKRRKAQDVRRRHLHDLTAEEKGYLAPYILQGVTSQTFELEDGVAGGLAAKKIIYRSSTVGSVIDGFPYNIQPWARDYLREHPELLEGATAPRKRREDYW